MTHAMVISGVHLDVKTGKPIRYKVENSWGEASGDKGYFVMTDAWFEQYVVLVVAFLLRELTLSAGSCIRLSYRRRLLQRSLSRFTNRMRRLCYRLGTRWYVFASGVELSRTRLLTMDCLGVLGLEI